MPYKRTASLKQNIGSTAPIKVNIISAVNLMDSNTSIPNRSGYSPEPQAVDNDRTVMRSTDESSPTGTSRNNSDSNSSSAFSDAPPSPNDNVSDESSALSSLHRLPSPPAAIPRVDGAAAYYQQRLHDLEQLPMLGGPSIPSLVQPSPASPPETEDSEGQDEDSSSDAHQARKPRYQYKVECTHTETCTCHMHAAHPSVRGAQGRKPAVAGGDGRYAHLSEWALAAREWPESALRSTLCKDGGGEGLKET